MRRLDRRGRPLGCERYTTAVEGSDPKGIESQGRGGDGRGELSLQSDIDVLLLHAATASTSAFWPTATGTRSGTPGWKLGHAVRTVKEALALAADDLDTATGLLQARHLAGDRALTDELSRKAELQWRKRAKRWLTALLDRCASATGGRARSRSPEPDLKEGRGGCATSRRWPGPRALDPVGRRHGQPRRRLRHVAGRAGRAAPAHGAGRATACCSRSRTRWPRRSAVPTPTC